jgi:hypothetical protein
MMTAIIAQLGPEDLFTAEKLTLVGVLVAVIWAIMTRRLVPGPFYEDLKRENEELRRALDRWRDTGRAIAGTAQELARRERPPRAPEPRPAGPLPLPPDPDTPEPGGE